MMDWIVQYWIEAVFGVVVSLFGFGLRAINKKIKRVELVESGMQALLRDRIIQAYNHYMEKEYCPIYGLESIEEMYKSYHDLGGNGTITRLYNELRELPTEKPRKDNVK